MVKYKQNNQNERISFFKKICQKHKLKITPQRIAIYQELSASSKHPSALVIFNKIRNYFPNISLGTVNSTLLTFAKIGLIKVVESSGDPKRFDSNLDSHHHFRCVSCGRIIDFHDDSYDALKIPKTISKKYIVLDKIVHLQGFCDKCRAK